MGDVPLPEELVGPQPPSAEDVVRYVVATAVWAPSLHNTQPWRFSADGREIILRADPSRQLPVADPDGREMLISCGAALFTARLALRSLGYIPEARVLPAPDEPTLVARVSFRDRAPAAEYELRLLSQVRQRRTHRGGFDTTPLSPDLLAALREGAARDGTTLRIMADDERQALAAAVQTAERAFRLDSARVQELARWTPAPGSARADGVPPTSYPAHVEHTSPDYPGRDFAHGHGWGLPLFSSTPWRRTAGTVGLLTTADDTPQTRSIPDMHSSASCLSLARAEWQQPCTASRSSFPACRRHPHTDERRAYPQLVLRLGTIIQVAASVRRAPDDVMF